MSRSVTSPSTPIPSLCGVLTMRLRSVTPFSASGANRRGNTTALISADHPAPPERLDLGGREAGVGEHLVAVLTEGGGPGLHRCGRIREAEGWVEHTERSRRVAHLAEGLPVRELRIGHGLLDGAIRRARHAEAIERLLACLGVEPTRPLLQLVDEQMPVAPSIGVGGEPRVLQPVFP